MLLYLLAAKFRGEFEDALKAYLKELHRRGVIISFLIDRNSYLNGWC